MPGGKCYEGASVVDNWTSKYLQSHYKYYA